LGKNRGVCSRELDFLGNFSENISAPYLNPAKKSPQSIGPKEPVSE